MQVIMAILSLALLMCVEAASAQTAYSVSVSRHSDLSEPLSEDDVKGILDKASKVLKKSAGHLDTPDSVACNVTFTLKGSVRTFGSTDTPAMVDEERVDAVHRVVSDVDGVDFQVKVVRKITNFCRIFSPLGFNGCSFPPNFRSIIVVHPATHTDPANPSQNLPSGRFPDHLLWAHEFGHLTGLGHRDEPRALMTPCDLSVQFSDVPDSLVQVTPDECRCLRSGLGSCPLPRPLARPSSCRRPQ
jgi:hypothetical protein